MNIPNIIAQVKADLSVTLLITALVKRLLNNAKIIEPKAPTAAASVGVAIPANIEPSTHIIRNIGGIKDLKIIIQSSDLVFGPKSSGRGGANLGLNFVLMYIYTV